MVLFQLHQPKPLSSHLPNTTELVSFLMHDCSPALTKLSDFTSLNENKPPASA